MAPPKEWPMTMGGEEEEEEEEGEEEGGKVVRRKARRSAAWVLMVMLDSWEGEGEREVPRKEMA